MWRLMEIKKQKVEEDDDFDGDDEDEDEEFEEYEEVKEVRMSHIFFSLTSNIYYLTKTECLSQICSAT